MPSTRRLEPLELSHPISSSDSTERQLISLKRQTKYLNIINQFSIALMELNNLKDVYQYVTKDVVAKLGFEDCVVYILNEKNQTLEQVSANGLKGPVEGQFCDVNILPLGQGIVGYCAANAEVVICNDTSKDSRYIADIHPALSEIAVPILYENKVIGVIDCENGNKDAYNQEHQQILVTVAAILSTKMQKSLAIEELEQSVHKLEYAENLQASLFRIASLKSSAEDIHEFYQEIHQIVNSLLVAKNFFIAMFDE